MKPKKIDNRRYRIDERNYIYRNYKGTGIILNKRLRAPDRKSCSAFQLNATGCVIMDRIIEHETFDAIVQHLVRQFAISPVEARKDALTFIETLTWLKVLVRQAKDGGQ